MTPASVVVLGGGLSGCAAAYSLARAGVREVTVIEAGGKLGGLAGSFERGGHFYPLGYHHILHLDRTLLYFLDLLGALPAVRWRRIRMLFELEGRLHDLATPGGFLRFPMSPADKVRFCRLMLVAFLKRDWSDWQDRSAADLVEHYGGRGVREGIFDRLSRLKFELLSEEVSGAWLGARLHFREGSAPLGYIPGANWTKVLCDGVTRLLQDSGVRVLLNTRITRLHPKNGLLAAAELASGGQVPGEAFVSTLPTETYVRLVPGDRTPGVNEIRYSALLSVVCATRQRVEPEAYWINLASLEHTACAIFLLTALNPTIGQPGDTCVNFVTHLRGRDRALFQEPDDVLLNRYHEDFRAVFGFRLEPFWVHVARIPMYSPVFVRQFRNPPVRSESWSNLYFAGNYRTFPSIASTGTALGSGLEAAAVLLADHGLLSDLHQRAARFRLESMPRAEAL